MRAWLTTAALSLLLVAACSPFGGTASLTPSPSRSPDTIPSPSPSPTPSPTPSPSPSPSPRPTPTSLYVFIVGSDFGDITAQSVPGATCDARALTPTGQDIGGIPNPKVADGQGNLLWTYSTGPIPTGQTGGQGESIVTCSHNGLSGTAWNYFSYGT